MTKKQQTFFGCLTLLVGIIGGIAGTAFAIGTEKQRIHDILRANTIKIAEYDRELGRYSEIIASQLTQLQTTVSDLRADVRVLKALTERIEKDLRDRNSD